MLKRLGKLVGFGKDDDGPHLRAAVFGKHPGWNDHMDELGLVTPRLVEFRRTFYAEGVGSLIDQGTWEALGETERLERFDHAFARRTGGAWLVGRFWSSTDGRGRSKYPMIVVVDCGPYGLETALKLAMPATQRAKEAFCASKDAAGVIEGFARLQAELTAEAEGVEPGEGPGLSHAQALRRLFNHPGITGIEEDAVLRALYGAERELGAVLGVIGASSSSVGTGLTMAEADGQVRLPRAEPESSMAIRLWGGLLSPALRSRVVLTVYAPEGAGWVDAVTGTKAESLACLRSTPERVPLASEIPYTIDEAFRERVSSVARPRSDSDGPGGA